MKILNIVLLGGAALPASGTVAAKQPTHLPPHANEYYGFYQGPADGNWPPPSPIGSNGTTAGPSVTIGPLSPIGSNGTTSHSYR